MIEVFEVDPARPERARAGIEAATAALRAGDLVVFPTDTVYGIAGRPDDPRVTGRVFAAKARPAGLSLPILVPDAGSAWELAVKTPGAERLARAFWPGALTLVLRRTDRSRPWRLGDATATLGVRVPDHPLTRALLSAAGPLAATSANLSGRSPLSGRDELIRAFGDAVAVYLIAAGAGAIGGRPSTVVDLSGDSPAILRSGAIETDAVMAALREG